MTRQPSLLSRSIFCAAAAKFEREHWRIEGAVPAERKFVLAGAPHTSNWDFIAFLGATRALGIRPSFIGKQSLFRWPLKHLMLDMGGIPVDRSARANYVEQVVKEFERRDDLALVIAPEGTRASDGRWKSGFYHIAMGAGVPIVTAWIDLPSHRLKIGQPIYPCGDYRADLARIAEFFRAADPASARFARIDANASLKPKLSNRASNALGRAS